MINQDKLQNKINKLLNDTITLKASNPIGTSSSQIYSGNSGTMSCTARPYQDEGYWAAGFDFDLVGENIISMTSFRVSATTTRGVIEDAWVGFIPGFMGGSQYVFVDGKDRMNVGVILKASGTTAPQVSLTVYYESTDNIQLLNWVERTQY